MALARADIPRIAIENPVCIMSSLWRRPDQVIHPWQHGHGETKATCLWLRGLPLLAPSCIVDGREARVHRMPPSATRGLERSRTYPGIAQAMADQWGKVLETIDNQLVGRLKIRMDRQSPDRSGIRSKPAQTRASD
jgi:hypothetical protein